MALQLTVFRKDGTTVTYQGQLADSIRQAAEYVAAAAAADPLAGPTAPYVRAEVIRHATERLRRRGDVYRGPAGGTWVVHRRDDQVRLDEGEPRFTRPED